MRFCRIVVDHTTGQVLATLMQDKPFASGMVHIDGHDCEAFDLGLAEDADYRDADGEPCTPSQFFHDRARYDSKTRRPVLAQGTEYRLMDCPCTLETLKARVRGAGVKSIPAKARAWLATMLPPGHVDALGIARGLPVSALKACEAMRAKRDPNGGTRSEALERTAQKLSDIHSARHLARARRAGKGKL